MIKLEHSRKVKYFDYLLEYLKAYYGYGSAGFFSVVDSFQLSDSNKDDGEVAFDALELG